jgi:tetratricopeptide (TPR) repeat protein
LSAERLRECQRRLDKPLTAYYYPLLFEPVAVSSPDDARLTLIRYLVKTGQPAAAETWLGRCHRGDSRTMALKARVAFDTRRYEDAVSYLQQIISMDEELRSDAYLLMGLSLDALGQHEAALSALESAVGCAHHEHVRRYARYRIALVQEGLGQERDARRALERIYSEDSSYLDVASRLGVTHCPDKVSTTDAWQGLLAELESGRVITDQSIADNR